MKAEITVAEYLARMRSVTTRLHELFQRPDPGMGGWHIAVCREMAELEELWHGKDVTVSVTPE